MLIGALCRSCQAFLLPCSTACRLKRSVGGAAITLCGDQVTGDCPESRLEHFIQHSLASIFESSSASCSSVRVIRRSTRFVTCTLGRRHEWRTSRDVAPRKPSQQEATAAAS